MLTYRCKCGDNVSWGSMPPFVCQSCPKCGSDLATSPSLHREPAPHDFIPRLVETDEGEKTLSRCRYCGRTRAQIERAAQAEKVAKTLAQAQENVRPIVERERLIESGGKPEKNAEGKAE